MRPTMVVAHMPLGKFERLLNKYEGRVYVNPHAIDHLGDPQRKVFKLEELSIPLTKKEKPRLVGLQKNGRISAFYRRTEGYLRLVLIIKPHRLEVISFSNVDVLPRVVRQIQ